MDPVSELKKHYYYYELCQVVQVSFIFRCFVAAIKMVESLFDMAITTLGILVTMILLSCLCCLCMKISDLRLKCYIIETAKKKGIDVDLNKLESKGSLQTKDETCAIMVPDICVITV